MLGDDTFRAASAAAEMLQEGPLERRLASLAFCFDPVAQIAWDQVG